MKLIFTSVVCWKNTELTTTKRFSNVQMKRKATKGKTIVIWTRKETKNLESEHMFYL